MHCAACCHGNVAYAWIHANIDQPVFCCFLTRPGWICSFVLPGSEIYGGFQGTFEYGPLGSQLKKNVRDAWWRSFVEQRPENVGFDSSIIMSPKVSISFEFFFFYPSPDHL